MKKRVAILISGGGSNMLSLVDSMIEDHPAKAVIVISNVADAAGLEKARARGIETVAIDHRTFENRRSFELALNDALASRCIDIICLAGFMRILTSDFIAAWHGRIMNIHPSLLPKYKGLNTHARALEAADTLHGCTVHGVTPALDDGPILGQAQLCVSPNETEASLASRVLALEHQLYPAVLRRFASDDTTPVFIDG